MKGKEHPTSNTQHPTSNDAAGVRKFDLEERMLAHAASIVRVFDSLSSGTGAKQIGNQLVRSGTSPYLHHGEVEAAESLDDFVHKLKVCLKELRETWRALRLLKTIGGIKEATANVLIDETHQLIRIFWQSIKTARSRGESNSRLHEDAPSVDDWMLGVGCWMLDVEPPPEPPAGPVNYKTALKKRRPRA